jgi:hypothetical protein
MTLKVRVAIASVVLAVMLALILTSDAISGGPDKKVVAAVVEIADAFKKGKTDDAAALAKKAAKLAELEEVADVMHLFKNYNKGGLGWGPKRAANPTLDGLDKKLLEYTKNVKAADAADPNNEDAGYWIAAIIEISKHKAPAKDGGGGKTKKAWEDFSKSTSTASIAFAKASTSKNASTIKSASEKVYATCVNCHNKFK